MNENNIPQKDDNIATPPYQNDTLNEILGKILTPTQQSTPQPPTAEANTAPSGDILSSLMANPQLLTKLPSIIAAVKPMLDAFSTPSHQAQALDSAKVTGHSEHNKKNDADCRSALLCAMKPYLSRDRQNAIDYIIKLSRLGDILKTL